MVCPHPAHPAPRRLGGHWLAVLAVLTLGACGTAPPRGEAVTTAETIAALERGRFDAMTRQDAAALELLLAEDLTYCHSNGTCETKAEFLATIRSGRLRYRAIEVEQLTPRPAAAAWVVTGVIAVEAEVEGRVTPLRLTFTDVYVPAPGGWQLMAWHSARIP